VDINDEYMLLHQISYFNWTKILIIDMLLLLDNLSLSAIFNVDYCIRLGTSCKENVNISYHDDIRCSYHHDKTGNGRNI